MTVLHGAMVDSSTEGNESVTDSQIKDFIRLASKGLATVYFTDKWAQNKDLKFPLLKARICTNNNAVPFIRIQNSEDEDGEPGNTGKFSWKNILDGRWDKQLKLYGMGIDMFRDLIMIELGTEINGKWFSWSDEGPDLFKKGFRYIVKMFRNENKGMVFGGIPSKQSNVRFAFHCDATDNNDSKKWYPGDDVCDWIGTSCYGADTKKGCIRTLDECYDNFSSISKIPRLGIFEWGIGDPHDTLETLTRLPKDYPRIELLQLWNEKVIKGHKEDDVPDGRIDVTPENLEAYHKGIANPIYTDKYYGT